MSRARVACLTLVCALLVCDGDRRSADPRASDGASAGRGGFAEETIAGYLGEMNPQLSERQSRRIAAAVLRYSEKYRLDPSLVVAVISAESSARPWARSSKGAVGLMQVMPYMMGSLPVAGNLTSIESNIEAGCMILADNIRRLGERRGILAYFWGNDVRGVAYLERVQRARADFLRRADS